MIFAIDGKVFPLYEKLAAFLPSAAVGTLTDSSTNIVNLLRENYDKIANRAELMLTYDTDSLEVRVAPIFLGIKATTFMLHALVRFSSPIKPLYFLMRATYLWLTSKRVRLPRGRAVFETRPAHHHPAVDTGPQHANYP